MKSKHDDSALHVSPGVGSRPNVNPALAPRARQALSVDNLVAGIRASDRGMLSRAITLLESALPEHQKTARAVMERCLPHAGNSVRVGITGVPGVGKSTFIEALGTRLTGQGRRLAVLAIDPTSERTHGSILGDKTRMERLAADPAAFIRPSPTRGALGGVAATTRETMLLCEAAGFDVVFVETVGVGQSETAVASMVDFFLLLVLAGAGDELQGIKRGIFEMADAVVVTKTDEAERKAVTRARADYRNALHLFPPKPSGWHPRVLTCSALTGDGIDAVWQLIEDHLQHTQQSGFFVAQRREQARHWMHQTIEQQLRQDFLATEDVQAAVEKMEAEVLAGRVSPTTAAQDLLALYRGERKVKRD